jgi:hypothetical protein
MDIIDDDEETVDAVHVPPALFFARARSRHRRLTVPRGSRYLFSNTSFALSADMTSLSSLIYSAVFDTP